MKIILSRKGFDSGTGGCASPIINSRCLLSLPIPDERSPHRYDELAGEFDLGKLVTDLSGGRVQGSAKVHLDPDLNQENLQRTDGWRPSFGQTGAAQSHLVSQGVGIGDIFLFFGWFRDVVLSQGRWVFQKGGRNIHAVFGWLQIGEIVSLASGEHKDWCHYPWLAGHPHIGRVPDPLNVIYVAAEELVLPGAIRIGLPGAGSLDRLSPSRILTDQKASMKSVWRLPRWFAASADCSSLSYHASPDRWVNDGHEVLLRSVARGQEFVLDCANRPEASDWLSSLLTSLDDCNSSC